MGRLGVDPEGFGCMTKIIITANQLRKIPQKNQRIGECPFFTAWYAHINGAAMSAIKTISIMIPKLDKKKGIALLQIIV